MTRHLLRLIWNRKRQNFLLTVEIFFSFLTLFGVVLLGMQYANNARHPLGYQVARVWSIGVDRKEPAQDPAVKARHRETYNQLLMAFRDMPQIEVVAAGFTGPYTNAFWGSGTRLPGGRQVEYGANSVTDSYRELLNMQVVEGRWFSREDDAATWKPVVINRRLAREIFGDASAVGQIIPNEPDPEAPPPDPGATQRRAGRPRRATAAAASAPGPRSQRCRPSRRALFASPPMLQATPLLPCAGFLPRHAAPLPGGAQGGEAASDRRKEIQGE